MRFYTLFLFIILMISCNGETAPNSNVSRTPENTTVETNNAPVPTAGYEVVGEYKHDSNAFTQGLLYRDGFLYESTGQYGDSSLRKVDFKTGKVLQKYDVSKDYFAEGIALVGDKIYQLTWRSGIGFIYDANSFKLQREFRYSGEGWGLTTDGKVLYHSDGTHVIRVVNPEDYTTTRTLVVKNENGQPLMRINELEFVKGEIWANIWHSEEIGKPNHIARISPDDGKLLGWINLSGISPDDVKRDDENTMNGIAYDAENDRIFVTGKKWKKLFEIKLK